MRSKRAAARKRRLSGKAGLRSVGDWLVHYLRVLHTGLAASAYTHEKSERAIMAQTGHRSAAMMRRYIRDADLFSENAAAGLL